MSPGEFYSAVYDKAIELGANDVQARLAASQASEETGFGQHMVGNNAFGIKAGSSYTGPAVTASTEEEYNGNTVRENANFRAYDDFTDSVKDYLSTIQSNFPDAWSAPTFSDAVAGLKTGVYGSYATRAAYPQHITAIDNKYGALQYAQDPENVPTPYSAVNAPVDVGLADDVLPVDDPNFKQVDPALAYANNPANVPVPEAKPNLPTGGLLTAFQENPDYKSPFDVVLSQEPAKQEPASWGLNPDVAPALVPTVNSWAPVAAAEPVSSPMGSVQASGVLGVNPELAANATANPMMSLAATGLLGTAPGLSADATVSGLPEVASVSSRMGVAEPGFDPSRFDGLGVSVADGFDEGRFASPPSIAFDPSRFGAPTIDVATNTQSFADQPATIASPADIGSFADAYSAQRGPTTGVNSAEMQAMRGSVENQLQRALQDPQLSSFASPSFNVPATASIAGVPALDAQATVPSLQTAYTQTPAVTPAEQAITDNVTTGSITPGLLSPTSIATANAPLSFTPSPGIIPGQPVQQNAFVDSFPSAVANNMIEPATINDVVAAPTLDTMQIAEQPAVATVDGPATTPAIEQQQTQVSDTAPATTVSRTAPARTTQSKGLLSGLFSPETATGGLLGGLALGPAGGLLGALAGQQIARSGGLASMFSSQPMTINNIGTGPAASYSVWGGGQPIGTQATASDGSLVTQAPGGLVAVTGPSGVTTGFDSTGKGYAMFGGAFDQDEDSEAA